MRRSIGSQLVLTIAFGMTSIFSGCKATGENANTTATSAATPPGAQQLTVVERPQKIEQMMKDRGAQDEAKPTLKIISPADGAAINGSTLGGQLEIGGELQSYMAHEHPGTQK